MKKTFISLLLGLAAWSLQAQEESVLKAALYLSGAATVEEIPADLIDRLESEPPARVNSPRLRAGLLLTNYQVACIRDYRARHGDILSAEELALVDGFGADAATALAPFLSFTSSRLPGQPDSLRPTPRATALIRGTLTTFGGKLKASGESALSWRVGGAWRRSGIWSGLEAGTSKGGGSAGTTDGSFYADATLGPWRLLIGHFNTRWGQGLAAWSGFGMESLSTLSAFIKRPTGISPVWSYAPSSVHRGLALEYSAPRFRAQAFAGLGNDYGFHTDLLGRSSQLGITFLWADGAPTFSLDGRYTFRGATLATEIAYQNRSAAFKAASLGRLGESWKWAAQVRIFPSRYSGKKYGEYGAAIGLAFASRGVHSASLTADAALLPIPASDPRRFQLRVYSSWLWQLSPQLQLDTRFTERYRNYEAPRTDVRTDLKFTTGPWIGNARLEAVHCSAWAFLSYLESGYKTEKSAIYTRITGFSVPIWDARIYCYERDAPGTFSVPAYNGRGIAFSAVGSLKLQPFRNLRHGHPLRYFSLKGNLRTACQLRTDRRPTYTLALQLQADL